MSESQHKKSRRIPTVSEGRLDENPSSSAVSYKKEDQRANAFIRGREATQPLTLRLPLSLHQKLREIAFKTEDKITHIILRAIREHVKKVDIQEENLHNVQTDQEKTDT